MKRILLSLATILFALTTQAQTALKVHSTGQLSLQCANTSYGIQIPTNGVMSIQPNITNAYAETAKTLMYNTLAKAWVVKPSNPNMSPSTLFYVLGNGNTYATGYYTINIGGGGSKGSSPIVGATELVTSMKGYYLDSNEFEGVSPEEIVNCGNIVPEALEGILGDMEKGKIVGMDAEELEAVLPEAVRHEPDGNLGINYCAIVPVLIEAFKEQQAKIEQLESILRQNNLLK